MLLAPLPPFDHSIHGKVRRVAGGRHTNMALVAFRIVNTIRRRAAHGIGWEVMVVDLLTFRTPRLALVFELAEKLLFLRINADSRVAAVTEFLALGIDVSELLIALGVGLAGVQHFAMAAQAVFLFAQQATDGRRAGPMIQLLRQPSQPTANPLLIRTRIAGRFGGNTSQQIGD